MVCICEILGDISIFTCMLVSFVYFQAVFNEIVIPLALLEDKMIIANLGLGALLAIYHLKSNASSWNYSLSVLQGCSYCRLHVP